MSFFSKIHSFAADLPDHLAKLKEIEEQALEVIAEIQAARTTLTPLIAAAQPLVEAAKGLTHHDAPVVAAAVSPEVVAKG